MAPVHRNSGTGLLFWFHNKEKMRKEEQGECDDETELEMALSEIIEIKQATDLERKENSNTLTRKNENDKASKEHGTPGVNQKEEC